MYLVNGGAKVMSSFGCCSERGKIARFNCELIYILLLAAFTHSLVDFWELGDARFWGM
jgi:hypothetical protein